MGKANDEGEGLIKLAAHYEGMTGKKPKAVYKI